MLAVLELLLIEGDEKTRDLFTFFLRAKGHRVREARDTQEARLIATSRRVDVVLIGAKLLTPGHESVVQELRGTLSPIPFVVIADYRLNGHHADGVSSGSTPDEPTNGDLLEHPFTFNDLSAVLDRIAAKK